MPRASDVWKYVTGLILAVLLLYWVFRDTNYQELVTQTKQASLPGLLGCAVLNAGHNLFRLLRWRLLLRPVRRRVPYRPMFAAVTLGYLTSWVVPGRIGEIVRPMVLSAREPVPLGPCIGTVVADRLLDAISVALLFAVGLLITPLGGAAREHARLIRTGSALLLAGTAALLLLLVLASWGSARTTARFDGSGAAVRWAWRSFLAVAGGARALRSPALAAGILLHGLAAWLMIAAGNWFGMRAVGADIPFGASLLILPMLVLGVAIPTPAGAGSYHALMKQGLLLFGVSEVTAVSAGLLIHASITIPILGLGLGVLWFERVSWRELLGAARQFKNLGGTRPDQRSMGSAT